jgi:hypothetical protein
MNSRIRFSLRYSLLLIEVVLLASVGAFAQPKIFIPEGLKPDFGEVYTSAIVKRSMTLINRGKDTLTISGESASCGCTSVSSTHSIAPGDSGSLLITFNPKTQNGRVTKSVSFETNDPKNSHVHIDFAINVAKVVEVDPEYVTFPNTYVDSAVSGQFTLKNLSAVPIHIFRILSSSDMLTAVADTTVLAPQQKIAVTCTLTPKSKGIFKGNLTVKIDSRKLPAVELRVFGLVKEPRK